MITERAETSGVVSVLAIRRSQTSDSGIYQCRSTSDRSVAIRRVHVLNGNHRSRIRILRIFVSFLNLTNITIFFSVEKIRKKFVILQIIDV